jgi:hypothetical protein
MSTDKTDTISSIADEFIEAGKHGYVKLSAHAITRWMQRANQKNPRRAANSIIKHLKRAIPFKRWKKRWYHQGWVIVVDKGLVITVFRPTRRAVMDEVKESVTKHGAPL